jgi:type IV pilus biogenesis protein CpaD/CtpE
MRRKAIPVFVVLMMLTACGVQGCAFKGWSTKDKVVTAGYESTDIVLTISKEYVRLINSPDVTLQHKLSMRATVGPVLDKAVKAQTEYNQKIMDWARTLPTGGPNVAVPTTITKAETAYNQAVVELATVWAAIQTGGK